MSVAPSRQRVEWLRTVLRNPVWRKSFRSRLRLRHVLSWGTIVVSLTTFACLMSYLTGIHRADMTPQEAARVTLIPLIVIQGLILMLLGTGAVASGITIEREQRLLDYQRMTPMSPLGKIVGYLFGLPVREYALFLTTVPFVIGAVSVSGIPAMRVLHFYGVFFSSVLVYHMTGLAAGMVARKPRNAVMMSTGMVVVLYFLLPNLSFVGLRFFEFLTIRPTFYRMVLEELQTTGHLFTPPHLVRYLHGVPFFNMDLHPTTYTVIVQGFLILTMGFVLFRKWADNANHAFTKSFALFVGAGVMTFLFGSIWPLIVDEAMYDRLMEQFRGRGPEPPQLLAMITLLLAMLSGTLILFLVHVISPTRHTIAAGYRRTAKLGRRMLNPDGDAATSAPATIVLIVMTVIWSWVLFRLVLDTGRFFTALPPLLDAMMPLALFASILLFVQALRERLGARAFGVILFVFWVVPFFASLILYAAFEEFVLGTWVALPFPPTSQALSIGRLFNDAATSGGELFLPPDLQPHAPAMVTVATVGYALLAAVMQVELFRWRRAIRRSTLS